MNDKIDLENEISIEEFSSWMDGGTLTLNCIDKNKITFTIEITQHVQLEKNARDFEQKIPGRVYINDTCVEPRSELESKVLTCLIKLTKNIQGIDHRILSEKIAYVKSERYLDNIKITNKAFDEK